MHAMNRIVLLSVLLAPPLVAQRNRQTRPPVTTPPAPLQATPKDTGGVRRTPEGFVLDFQDQDIRVVLSAIAEAGGLNVTLTNLPQKRVTLRMGQPATKAAILDVLKGVAASNGLTVIESASLIRIEGAATVTGPTVQQQMAQQQQAQQLRLYTYRLKHASAAALAPVLTNLLVGGGNAPQTTIFGNPNNPGGLQIFNPAQPGAANNAGAPGGGRGQQQGIQGVQQGGGRGNQAAQALAELGAVAQQRALDQGRGGGQGVQNAIQNAIQQAFGGGGAPLSNSASQIKVVAEEVTNSLLVRATAEDWALLQQVLLSVDLRPLQVLIEVTIAQVTRNKDLNVGIGGIQTNKKSATVTDTMAILPSSASARDFVLMLTGGKGAINYNLAINALQTRGDVRVLSLPVIIAQNNKEAILNVGSQRPFVQISQTVTNDPTGRVQTVQYINVGTTLTITPTINPDGYVNMAVKQTANAATNEVQFSAPVITTREATTQVFLRDGQTTVIGGLADNTTSKSTSGIPFLSRIPLIGGLLFGNTQNHTEASELFLFLTPHVVSTDEDIDRLRNEVQNGNELLMDVPVTGRIHPKADTLPVTKVPAVRPDASKTTPDSVGRRPEPR